MTFQGRVSEDMRSLKSVHVKTTSWIALPHAALQRVRRAKGIVEKNTFAEAYVRSETAPMWKIPERIARETKHMSRLECQQRHCRGPILIFTCANYRLGLRSQELHNCAGNCAWRGKRKCRSIYELYPGSELKPHTLTGEEVSRSRLNQKTRTCQQNVRKRAYVLRYNSFMHEVWFPIISVH